jgi:SAM-dependent methyltransferase
MYAMAGSILLYYGGDYLIITSIGKETRYNQGVDDSVLSAKDVEKGYDNFWNTLKSSSDDWASRSRSLRGRAVTLVSPPVKGVLDMGCGNGEALKVLSNRGIDLYGIDISLRALSDARRYGSVFKGDLTRLPIRDSSFSCVLLLDVFEHVMDKSLLMEEVHRVLSDSGIVIMTIPLPKATNGQGDPRQPYDKPLSFKETNELVSDMFEVESLLGFPWLPVFNTFETYVPLRVGFALFRAFPMLIERADSALLMLKKRNRV